MLKSNKSNVDKTDIEIQDQVFNESHLQIFKLSTGDLKRVESLSTEDFIRSAKSSPEVKIDQSTVTAIEPCNDRGTVIITFSVGKDKVQVRTSFMSILESWERTFISSFLVLDLLGVLMYLILFRRLS